MCRPEPVKPAGSPGATGAFTESFTDAQVSAPGIPFNAGRVYSSNTTTTGALGKGWQLPWETRLKVEADGDVVLTGEGGARTSYTKKSGSFTTPGQARSTLSADGSGYKPTTADHRVYAFNAAGQFTSQKDRTGKGLPLGYTGSKPTQITDAAGRAAALTYTGERLDKVTLADGRFVGYDYTADQLTGVKDLDGATEQYGYDGGLLSKVTDARNKVVTSNVYDAQGRMKSQTDALQNTTNFTYTKNGQFDQTDVTALKTLRRWRRKTRGRQRLHRRITGCPHRQPRHRGREDRCLHGRSDSPPSQCGRPPEWGTRPRIDR